MRNMKKLISLVLAIMMVGLVGLAFADGPETPAVADGTFVGIPDGTINASNLDAGDTVYYIQLVEWNGLNNGSATTPSASWKLTSAGETAGITVDNLVDGITAAEAAQIAIALTNVAGTAMTTNGTSATATVAPGLYYLRAVAESSDTIYNPAFVSSDYYQGGNTVDFSTAFSDSSVLKKSSVEFDKQVGQENEHLYTYNDVKPGDYIPYKITTKIPAYGAAYTDAQFNVSDTFSAGLVLAIDDDHPFTVTSGSTEGHADSVEGVYTSNAANDGSSFVINFDKTYLLNAARGVTDVTITYWGKVTTNAPKNVNVLDNTATLTYTNKPNTEPSTKTDITRHYTFSIDAEALGQDNLITRELMKIGLDQNGQPITGVNKETVDNNEVTALAGASFTLTPVSPTTGEAKTIDSDSTGRIVFKGLDAGVYTLVENSAPTGYVKDSRTYTVEIIPTYDETVKDMLKSYKIEFRLGETLVTTASFTCTGETKVTQTTIEDHTQFIGNTQGTELPSTGGIGTTIFYIVGGLLLVGAAVILVARRKASEN